MPFWDNLKYIIIKLKLLWLLFKQLWENVGYFLSNCGKIGLLFISTSGHSGRSPVVDVVVVLAVVALVTAAAL